MLVRAVVSSVGRGASRFWAGRGGQGACYYSSSSIVSSSSNNSNNSNNRSGNGNGYKTGLAGSSGVDIDIEIETHHGEGEREGEGEGEGEVEDGACRLSKLIASSGRLSRAEAEKAIKRGRVLVDGKVCLFSAVYVTPANQVTLDRQPVPHLTTNSNSNSNSTSNSSNIDSSVGSNKKRKGARTAAEAESDGEWGEGEVGDIEGEGEGEGEGLRPGQMRLSKFLSSTGVYSRGEAERMVREGRVRVDGELATHPAALVRVENNSSVVTVDDVPIRSDFSVKIKPRVWLVRKHADELMSEADLKGRPVLFNRLQQLKDLGEVKPVLRHDFATEGLCVFTNSGDFARFLQSPAADLKREFRVRVHGLVSKEKLLALHRGVFCENKRREPLETQLEKTSKTISWLKLSTTTMDNRMIRRCLSQLHLQVTRFVCTRFGPFRLDTLEGPLAEVPVPDELSSGFLRYRQSPAEFRSKMSSSNNNSNSNNSSSSNSNSSSNSSSGSERTAISSERSRALSRSRARVLSDKRVNSRSKSSSRSSSRSSSPSSASSRGRERGGNRDRDRDRDRDRSASRSREGGGEKSRRPAEKEKRQFTAKKRIMTEARRAEMKY